MTNEPADGSGFTSIEVRVPTRCAAAMRSLLASFVIPDGMSDHDAFAFAFASTVGVQIDGPAVGVSTTACCQPHYDPHNPPEPQGEENALHMLSDLQALGACAGAAYIKASQLIASGCKPGAPDEVCQFFWNCFYQSAHRNMHNAGVAFGENLSAAMEQMPASACGRMFGGDGGPHTG
jgi:hypothetical protein